MTLEAALDRLNPVVIKELRQGLRARVFSVSFGLLLAACVLVALVAASERAGDHPGARVFVLFFSGYAIIAFFVLPLGAYRSLARERQAETWPALALTRLRPRQIVRGKVLSALVQGSLYASAVAPFLLFSYFLEGIALVSILLVLALAAAWQVLVTAAAVSAATLPAGGFVGQGAFFAVVGGLGAATVGALALAGDVARTAHPADDPVVGVAVFWFLSGTLALVLTELAAGRLATRDDNPSLGPRLAMALHLLLPAIVLAVARPKHAQDMGEALLVYGNGLLFLFGTVALGEPDGPPRALAGTRPWLLLPGARRALACTLLLAALLALLLWTTMDVRGDPRWVLYLLAPSLLAMHLALPCLVLRGVGDGRWATPFVRWSATVGLVLFPVAAGAVGRAFGHDWGWTLKGLNAWSLLTAYRDPEDWRALGEGTVAFAAVTGIVVVLCDRALARRAS